MVDNNPILKTTGVFSNGIITHWSGGNKHSNFAQISKVNEQTQQITYKSGNGTTNIPHSIQIKFCIKF